MEGWDISSQIQASLPGGLQRCEAIKRVVLHCAAWEFSSGRRLQSPGIPQDRFLGGGTRLGCSSVLRAFQAVRCRAHVRASTAVAEGTKVKTLFH